MAHYNASSIKILTDDEINEFPWIKMEQLADEYNKPLSFIQRGFDVSYSTGIDINYFIDKYIKNETIAINEEFTEAYKHKLHEDRR